MRVLITEKQLVKLIQPIILNEEEIGRYKAFPNTPEDLSGIVYKNPPNVKKMVSGALAITDLEGNLYVCDTVEATHETLITWLVDRGELKGRADDYWENDETGGYVNLVCWIHDYDGIFYLSTMYEDGLPEYFKYNKSGNAIF